MSLLLYSWTYEVHDVRDPNPVVRHGFDFRGGITDAERAQHVVELQAWRVLGLPQPVPVAALSPLPDGRVCPGIVGINMVKLAKNVCA
ncbi:hypothetical protein V7S43_002603 [Phytophthora oleae]|uniref:Uncharacterized protein n=1 Tax=Phytophthora oleae TaxID=2107226 RepID=A0ABD3G201_9STRA